MNREGKNYLTSDEFKRMNSSNCKIITIFIIFSALRIDKEIEDVLEEFSHNQEMKEKLLTGRRVTLAEELSKF